MGVPQRGEKAELVENALRNARESLARRLAESATQRRLLEGLAHAASPDVALQLIVRLIEQHPEVARRVTGDPADSETMFRLLGASEALGEFRAAKRMNGQLYYTPMMADCERGLERPQRAIELARGDESRMLDADELIAACDRAAPRWNYASGAELFAALLDQAQMPAEPVLVG